MPKERRRLPGHLFLLRRALQIEPNVQTPDFSHLDRKQLTLFFCTFSFFIFSSISFALFFVIYQPIDALQIIEPSISVAGVLGFIFFMIIFTQKYRNIFNILMNSISIIVISPALILFLNGYVPSGETDSAFPIQKIRQKHSLKSVGYVYEAYLVVGDKGFWCSITPDQYQQILREHVGLLKVKIHSGYLGIPWYGSDRSLL